MNIGTNTIYRARTVLTERGYKIIRTNSSIYGLGADPNDVPCYEVSGPGYKPDGPLSSRQLVELAGRATGEIDDEIPPIGRSPTARVVVSAATPARAVEPAKKVRAGNWGNLSPMALFIDITYVDAETAKQIIDHCRARDCFAFVDRHPNSDDWIFHSLLMDNGEFHKKVIASIFERTGSKQIEAEIEEELAISLAESGQRIARQVLCLAGIADIVTDTSIYEIKAELARDTVFRAIGQVLMYRQAIDPGLQPVLVGKAGPGIQEVIFLIRALGVEVMLWKK